MKGELKLIYKTIEFKANPFSYSLEFGSRITLVRGDSATGKTYLYQMLEDLKLLSEYSAIKLFNYKSEDFHSKLRECRNRFIVIDNADILLEEQDRNFINFEKSNQYLLFLRNCDGLNLSADSFTILVEDNYKITLQRELVIK
jgi:predicted ATPase